MSRITVTDFLEKKRKHQKLCLITAYDYPFASIADEAGVDAILVGDSLAMVVQGLENTLPVTMDEMIYHTKIVSRAAKNAMVIGDMPFLSYHCSTEEAVRNAGRFLKEAGASAVKIEGGAEVREIIRAMTRADIPVMAHLGLTPQAVHKMGGFRVQGKTEEAATQLLEDAKIVEQAGAFAVILEAIPAGLATRLTEELAIPTIGIGAGRSCDGQVLVMHDALGLFERFIPKFVKRYANLRDEALNAVRTYREEVEKGIFPSDEHSFR